MVQSYILHHSTDPGLRHNAIVFSIVKEEKPALVKNQAPTPWYSCVPAGKWIPNILCRLVNGLQSRRIASHCLLMRRRFQGVLLWRFREQNSSARSSTTSSSVYGHVSMEWREEENTSKWCRCILCYWDIYALIVTVCHSGWAACIISTCAFKTPVYIKLFPFFVFIGPITIQITLFSVREALWF